MESKHAIKLSAQHIIYYTHTHNIYQPYVQDYVAEQSRYQKKIHPLICGEIHAIFWVLWCRRNDNTAGHHPIPTIGAPTSIIPTIFPLDVHHATTLPIYPDLGQTPSKLDCIPSGLIDYECIWNATVMLRYFGHNQQTTGLLYIATDTDAGSHTNTLLWLKTIHAGQFPLVFTKKCSSRLLFWQVLPCLVACGSDKDCLLTRTLQWRHYLTGCVWWNILDNFTVLIY